MNIDDIYGQGPPPPVPSRQNSTDLERELVEDEDPLSMMASEISKTYAINALYVPVVTHALTVLEQREELLENKWAQVLTSQLATIRQDHDVRDERHNEAQALFRFPLSVISMEGS